MHVHDFVLLYPHAVLDNVYVSVLTCDLDPVDVSCHDSNGYSCNGNATPPLASQEHKQTIKICFPHRLHTRPWCRRCVRGADSGAGMGTSRPGERGESAPRATDIHNTRRAGRLAPPSHIGLRVAPPAAPQNATPRRVRAIGLVARVEYSPSSGPDPLAAAIPR